MFLKIAFEFFEIFIEHIFTAEFIPAAKVIDFHGREHSMFFKYPIDLLLLAPHDVPVVIISLFPLSLDETFEDAVFEGSFELDIGTE